MSIRGYLLSTAITDSSSECIRRVDYFTRGALLLSNALRLGVPVVWFWALGVVVLH